MLLAASLDTEESKEMQVYEQGGVLLLWKNILSLYCHLFVEKTIEIYLIRKKLSVNIHIPTIITELKETFPLAQALRDEMSSTRCWCNTGDYFEGMVGISLAG